MHGRRREEGKRVRERVKIYQASLACFYSLRFNDNSETAVAYFFDHTPCTVRKLAAPA